MAGRGAPTQELKAEREGVLAKIWDRSFPMAALLPPTSQALSPGPGRDRALQGKNSAGEQAFPQSAVLGGLVPGLWRAISGCMDAFTGEMDLQRRADQAPPLKARQSSEVGLGTEGQVSTQLWA